MPYSPKPLRLPKAVNCKRRNNPSGDVPGKPHVHVADRWLPEVSSGVRKAFEGLPQRDKRKRPPPDHSEGLMRLLSPVVSSCEPGETKDR